MDIIVITGGSRGIGASTALGRVGEAEEVARVIASLLTVDGGWINAQNIEVAGGYIVYRTSS
ncbi:hypothetical protein [Bordetella tumulicola]|uniref:hypothetical protein n=1 Tax=Bordetella tumulicola TaxID=1649133 RepID=UPI0039EF1054